MEEEVSNFVTKLTWIDPNIEDKELFQDSVEILPYDLQRLLTHASIKNTRITWILGKAR